MKVYIESALARLEQSLDLCRDRDVPSEAVYLLESARADLLLVLGRLPDAGTPLPMMPPCQK